jgi:hypothetical protein
MADENVFSIGEFLLLFLDPGKYNMCLPLLTPQIIRPSTSGAGAILLHNIGTYTA